MEDNEQAESSIAIQPQGSSPASDDAERLIATGERLLRNQKARLMAGWAQHELRKTERANWFRNEMQKLADTAESELRALDQAWSIERQHIELMITKLKALRGGVS